METDNSKLDWGDIKYLYLAKLKPDKYLLGDKDYLAPQLIYPINNSIWFIVSEFVLNWDWDRSSFYDYS